jgi:hypothetical protein
VTNKNGFWTDDWIYWHLLYNVSESQSITTTHNQSSAEYFFLDCRGLAPFSFFLSLPLDSVLYHLCSLEADPIENTSVAQQWIYVNHIGNTSSVVKNTCLLARYLATDVLYCRVFLYALPNNCLFTKNLSPRERVYRAVAQQWVVTSQYLYQYYYTSTYQTNFRQMSWADECCKSTIWRNSLLCVWSLLNMARIGRNI